MNLKILAIDTSLAIGSVAALDGDRRAERDLPTPADHARLLAGQLVAAAADLGWTVAEADLVAVVRGPGSFTGLRVGVTTAKAIAWAAGCRLVAVSGFEVVATAAVLPDAPPQRFEIAFDAGRGEVYAASAGPAPGTPAGWTVGPPALHAALDWIAALPRNALVAGPAIAGLEPLLASRPDIGRAGSAALFSSAAHAARIAVARLAAGDAADPASLGPEYLRPSYADERRPGV